MPTPIPRTPPSQGGQPASPDAASPFHARVQAHMDWQQTLPADPVQRGLAINSRFASLAAQAAASPAAAAAQVAAALAVDSNAPAPTPEPAPAPDPEPAPAPDPTPDPAPAQNS